MIVAGVDAGSRALKLVLFDAARGEVLAGARKRSGVEKPGLAEQVLDELLAEKGLGRDDLGFVVATGYGRHNLELADLTVTEITCHAAGVRHVVPDARTIVEVGGQDSKLIRLDENGHVRDFSMNDRCAAGTGRFLEMVAERFDLPLEELGELAGKGENPAAISSMCVVFAETEIIGLLASGARPEDVLDGVQNALSGRIATMAGRGVEEPVVFTGGVALIPGMERALSTVLKRPVTVAPDPQMTGALGAALKAAREV